MNFQEQSQNSKPTSGNSFCKNFDLPDFFSLTATITLTVSLPLLRPKPTTTKPELFNTISKNPAISKNPPISIYLKAKKILSLSVEHQISEFWNIQNHNKGIKEKSVVS